MVRLGRGESTPASIQTELQRLQAIRLAAEQELGRLRSELGERVAAVERRERELADALAKVAKGKGPPASPGTDEALVHAQVALAARAQELDKREAELGAREAAIVELEADLARRAAGEVVVEPDERLAQIEARLKALQEAERAFARTQAELAVASDELAVREAELRERERALEAGTAAASGLLGPGMSAADLADLDDRLRRLEHETRSASTERTFGDGLRMLERKGTRGNPPK